MLDCLGQHAPIGKKLAPADTRRLLLALPEDVRLIIMAALFCTLRISEVLGLQWRHLASMKTDSRTPRPLSVLFPSLSTDILGKPAPA